MGTHPYHVCKTCHQESGSSYRCPECVDFRKSIRKMLVVADKKKATGEWRGRPHKKFGVYGIN